MTAGTERFADRLLAAVEAAGAPACVGLDPVHEKLPAALRNRPSPIDAIEQFCLQAIEAAAPAVRVAKVQSACFERFGGRGVSAMARVVAEARARGLIVILDAKRGDIATTAGHYAAFAFDAMDADAVTVNPYLGADAIEPFFDPRYAGRGVFALARTSNPASDAVQSQRLSDGRTVAEAVADLIAEAGAERVGRRGYSDLGAVVAATKPADAESLRRRMPRQIFLVPGFGAQGGSAQSVRPLFNADGVGAVISASRSVLYAFDDADQDWPDAIAHAAQNFAEQTRAAAPR